MENRKNFDRPQLNQGYSNSGNNNQEFNENKENGDTLIDSDIQVEFSVYDKYAARGSRPIGSSTVTDIVINIKFTCSVTLKQNSLIKEICQFQPQVNLSMGLLSNYSLHKKFGIERVPNLENNLTENTVNDKKEWEASFNLPRYDNDYLLQLLSIISDTIQFLERNKITVKFTLLNIIKETLQAYINNNEEYCDCAVILTKLTQLIANNPRLAPDQAILLLYCFSPLMLTYPELVTMNEPITITNIISVIDKLFLTQFIQSASNSQTKEDYLNQQNTQRKQEVNQFLLRLNLWQRINLYNPCLGRIADDKGLYNWLYIEWDFLSNVKFCLNKSGKVYIDINNNKNFECGYIKHYSPGKASHGVFAREMKVLGNLINFTFPDGLDWHKKITFAPDCEKKIFAMQLHFDANNIKKLLQARNNYSFFLQASKTGVFKEKLVKEIIKLIFTQAYGPGFLLEELEQAKNQSYSLRY